MIDLSYENITEKLNYYHSTSVSCDAKSNYTSEFPDFGAKGQIKPKADWHAVDSHKKRIKEVVLFFAVKRKKRKNRWFVHFSENLRRKNLLMVLSDL